MENIREQFPVLNDSAYFNSGTCGPVPLCCHQAMIQTMENELTEGRNYPRHAYEFEKRLEQLREEWAALIHASSEEMAITQNTTDGINIVVWGLGLKPGDEILTTSFEHTGGLAGLFTLQKYSSIRIRLYEPQDAGFDIDQFFSCVSERTRLIIISHVSWTNGMIVPLKQISSRARDAGIYVLADGAQAAGAIPVDVKELGVDFYAFPGHKWLCGPEGVGGLYLRSGLLERIMQTFTGSSSFEKPAIFPYFVAKNSAVRFETGTRFHAVIDGMLAGIRWMGREVGWEYMYNETRKINTVFRKRLQEETGLQSLLNGKEAAGLVTVRLPDYLAVHDVVEKLATDGIYTRFIPRTNDLRISTGFFNNEHDVEKLIGGLKGFIS